MAAKSNPEMIKASINAPCGYMDGRKRYYPPIDCDWECETCAFNPREQRRRVEEGHFINGSLHFKRRVFNNGT